MALATFAAMRYRVADTGDLGSLEGDGVTLTVPTPVVLRIPSNARISGVENQYGIFWLWLVGDPRSELHNYEVHIVGPGYDGFAELLKDEYQDLGRCVIRGGEQVYMLFGRPERAAVARGTDSVVTTTVAA